VELGDSPKSFISAKAGKRRSAAYPKGAILGQSATHFIRLQIRVNWFDVSNRPLSLTTRRAEFYSLKNRATFEVAVMWCCLKPGSPFKAK
jgi:hypothetical protein